MPGLRGRISTIVRAKSSAAVDRAENPAETLDYAYERQREELQNVKRGIAELATAKKGMQNRKSELSQQAETLDTQAREAVAGGHEDLARAALERKRQILEEAAAADQQAAELQRQQDELTASEQKLGERLEAFRAKKELAKAQYSAAKAEVMISGAETGAGSGTDDLAAAVQRTLDKTEDMTARAASMKELEDSGTLEDLTQGASAPDNVDRQLGQLGARSSVDEDLAKLKAELAPADPPKPDDGS